MPLPSPVFRVVLFGWILLSAARAEPESDLRNAVGALARTSYGWETTIRQRFSGETTEPKINLNAPLEVEGKVDPNGFTQITLLRARDAAGPITAVFRQGDVVVETPLGWLRRTEMRQTPGPDRDVEFEGKKIRLSRALGAALKAAEVRPPVEQLLDLIDDLKSCRSQDGLVIAELRDRTVEQLWNDANAKRAPEIQGTVIFKITASGLTECHFVLAIGFPNSRTQKIAWSMQQWTTRFASIGSTIVDPPVAAVQALDK